MTDEDVKWSYTLPKSGGKVRTLSLDARIPIEKVGDIVGYDLAFFFKRNSGVLKSEIDKVLTALLKAE